MATASMLCPRCGASPVEIDRDGVTIDRDDDDGGRRGGRRSWWPELFD
jgi:hypothetical protein